VAGACAKALAPTSTTTRLASSVFFTGVPHGRAEALPYVRVQRDSVTVAA
jgi:hypothetical protein